jgi:hypothetical protein
MSAPSPPIIIHAPLSSPNTLEFTWNRPQNNGGSDITGYRFQLDSEPEVILNENTFYYKVTGLINGRLYNATILAENQNGLSSKASFRPFEPGSPPNPPASGTASISGTNNAIVSWTPPSVTPDSTIFWYVLNTISNNVSDPVFKVTANGLTDSSYFFQGLNRNSQYSFDIQAVNCPGYSSALRTNTIQWFQSGDGLLATRSGRSGTTLSRTISANDSNGNVYVGITCAGNWDLYNYDSAPGGGAAIQTTLYGTINCPSANTIIAKYNSEGQVQWVTVTGGRGQNSPTPTKISTSPEGDIYVLYEAFDSAPSVILYNGAQVSGGTITPTAYGTIAYTFTANRTCPILVKYSSSNGAVLWATTFGGNSEYSSHEDLAIDSTGNIYVTVRVAGTSQTIRSFSAAPVNSTSPVSTTNFGTYSRISTYDILLIKYNSSGVAQWATSVTGLRTDSFAIFGGIAANSAGEVYAMYSSRTSSCNIRKFDNNTSSVINTSVWGTITSGSNNSAILVKYNSSGTPLWATRMVDGAVRSTPSLSLDSSNNLYIVSTWTFSANVQLYNYTSGGGSGSAVNTTQNGFIGYANVIGTLLFKFSSSGVVTRVASHSSGSFFILHGKSTCDSDGNFYVSVISTGALPLYNYSSQPATSTSSWGVTLLGTIGNLGSYDSYVVKYNSNLVVQFGVRAGGTSDEGRTDAEDIASCSLDGAGNLWVVGPYATNPTSITQFGSLPVSGGAMTLEPFGTLAGFSTNYNQAFIIKYAA